MKKFFVLVLFNLFIANSSLSNESNILKIIGNERITSNTIKETIDYNDKKKYSLEEINNIQKKLIETDFFSEVKVNVIKNIITINVKENPIIDFFYIKGIVRKDSEDFIYKNISLGNNKVFSEAKLKKDIDLIKDVLQKSGYYNVSVNTEISKLPGNVYNVVINVDQKNKYTIKNIYFIGDKKFSSSKLYDVISSTEDSWWKFLSSSSSINTKRIDYDKILLKEFYLDNGYFDVQINSSDINFLPNNSVEVVFSINAGQQYIFSKYKIIDDGKNLQKDDILNINKILNRRINGVFSKQKIRLTQNTINDYLNSKKIEFVKLNVIPRKNQSNIELEYIFSSSKRNFVNFINIKGNTLTDEEVIRRSLFFSEGDSFANYKIAKSENRLKKTGIFSNVTTKIINKSNELVDVEIKVEEQPTGSISAGLGVSTSGSSISTGIQEKNLFGKGINLSSNLNLGTEKISGSLDLKIPDFKNTDNTANFSLYALQTDYTNSGYESSVYGGGVSTSYEIYDDIFFRVGGSADVDTIDTNDTASDLYKSREGTYTSLKSFYSVNLDKRNRVITPTGGHLINFSQALAIPGASDITSIKNSINGSIYHQLSENYVLNLKGGFSSINSIDGKKDVKLSDRLSLNESKLRGFESFGIGPMSGNDHIGGNYSAYSSISSTFPNPFPDKWRASSIAFIDFGNVWGVDFDDSLDADKIRSSVGVSLEWNSPMGPLSIILSEPISSLSTDKEETFSFKIGGTF